VVEVVSPDDPERDTRVKRGEYAAARIPEYWIVNPMDDTVTVLTLVDQAYVEHGVFRRGDEVSSVLLDGFTVPVHAVFDAV
jgi:Uma2 family endonuclease